MTYKLQGFQIDTFSGPDWTWQERKAWLDAADDSGSGPYEMVAGWYRSVGRDHEARQIGIAKQDARTESLTSWRKPFHWLWRLLAGYGYQPWRAVGLLILVLSAGGRRVFLF